MAHHSYNGTNCDHNKGDPACDCGNLFEWRVDAEQKRIIDEDDLVELVANNDAAIKLLNRFMRECDDRISWRDDTMPGFRASLPQTLRRTYEPRLRNPARAIVTDDGDLPVVDVLDSDEIVA